MRTNLLSSRNDQPLALDRAGITKYSHDGSILNQPETRIIWLWALVIRTFAGFGLAASAMGPRKPNTNRTVNAGNFSIEYLRPGNA